MMESKTTSGKKKARRPAGWKHTEAAKEKLRSHTGWRHTEAAKEKMRANWSMSLEDRQKLSRERKGVRRSQETVLKIRLAGEKRKKPAEQRFFSHVCSANTDECWIWKGAVNGKNKGKRAGYGAFLGNDKKQVGAHRWSYDFHKGVVPDGMHVDHLCRNTLCVNPDHLEAVSPSKNSQRGLNGCLFSRNRRGRDGRFCSP